MLFNTYFYNYRVVLFELSCYNLFTIVYMVCTNDGKNAKLCKAAE